ncbi:DUF948 domain-containing protein [Oceanobacillus sp. CAU 1775]
MELIYLSTILIAVAFAIIVVYLCIVLKRVSNTMKSLSTTIGEVETKMNTITPELLETIQQTDKLVEDVEVKVQATDSLFDSLEDVGTSITSANDAFQNQFGELTDEEMDRKVKPFIEGIRWSEVGVRLYTDYQRNKKEAQNVNVTGREG